jgi:hypothetical protein
MHSFATTIGRIHRAIQHSISFAGRSRDWPALMHFLDYAGPTANENERRHGFPPKTIAALSEARRKGTDWVEWKVLKL